MSDFPKKPRLALTFGVTGHRTLRAPAPDGNPDLKPGVEEAAVYQTFRDIFARAKPIVAALGLDLSAVFQGASPELVLTSSLAEGADRIAGQAALDSGLAIDVVLPFSPQEYKETFADDAARIRFFEMLPHARACLTLPPFGATASEENQARAYESAGLTVLSRCDLLIAVWDRQPARGRGGTAEIVDAAAREGVPIVIIDPSSGAAELRWGADGDFPLPVARALELPRMDLESGLPKVIERLIKPPTLVAEKDGLRIYLATPLSRGAPAVSSDESTANKRALSGFEFALEAADAVASHCATIFRRAYVANFALGAAAGMCIAASVAFERLHYAFVASELAIVLIVTVWATTTGRRQWHRRWLEAREAAEMLRLSPLFWRLGIAPNEMSEDQPTWVEWYARAIFREQPMYSGDLSVTLPDAWSDTSAIIEGQRRYHADKIKRFEAIDRVLERTGQALVAITVLNSSFFVAGHYAGWTFLEGYGRNVTAVAIALSTLSAAVYGVRLFGDYEDIVRRSRRTDDLLARLQQIVVRDVRDLPTLRARARQLADAILSDLKSWRTVVSSRHLTV